MHLNILFFNVEMNATLSISINKHLLFSESSISINRTNKLTKLQKLKYVDAFYAGKGAEAEQEKQHTCSRHMVSQLRVGR